MKGFIEIICQQESEEKILDDLKKAVNKSKTYRDGFGEKTRIQCKKPLVEIPIALNLEYHTPLFIAVKKKYLSIIKYLLEEKGVNPYEVIGKRREDGTPITALSFVNFNPSKHEIALYLANTLKSFPREKNGYFMPLIWAVKSDNLEVVQAFLTRDQSLRKIKTHKQRCITLLQEAIRLGARRVCRYLLETSNKEVLAVSEEEITPYDLILSMGCDDLLAVILDKRMSPIRCNPLKDTLAISIAFLSKDVSKSDKRKCMNLLLGAGVGLDTSLLYPGILEFYGIKNSTPKLLLLAQQNEKVNENDPDQWKDKLITTPLQLEAFIKDYLTNPKSRWRFNINQIYRAAKDPVFNSIEHVNKIAKIIEDHNLVTTPAIQNSVAINEFSKKEILKLSLIEIANVIRKEWKDFSSISMISSPFDYYNKLSNLLYCLNHPETGVLLVDNNSIAVLLEIKIANSIMDIIRTKPDSKDLNFVLSINDYVDSLLVKHRNILKEKFPDVYAQLKCLKAQVSIDLASIYHETVKDRDLAFSFAMESYYAARNLDTCNRNVVSYLLEASTLLIALDYIVLARKLLQKLIKIYDLGWELEKWQLGQLKNIKALVLTQTIRDEKKLEILRLCADFLKNYQEIHKNDLQTNEFLNEILESTKELESAVMTLDHQDVDLPGSAEVGIEETNKKIKPTQDVQKDSEELTQLVFKLSVTLSDGEPQKPRQKIKTRPAISVNQEDVKQEDVKQNLPEKNYGFEQRLGFSPAIPVKNFLSGDTLFISLPLDTTFLPFLDLARDSKGQYHGIKSISKKSHGQQGVKFFTQSQGNKKIPIARVKVLGTHGKGAMRAIGPIGQKITTKSGEIRTLYEIQEVLKKKEEERRPGYFL